MDLSTLRGTGVGGRIRKQDVLEAAAAKKQQPAAAAAGGTGRRGQQAPAPSPLRGTTEKMSRLRKVIAARMVESLQVSAQLTTVVEVDLTKIARLRARAKADFEAREGVKLSFLPFLAKATVEALKAHPMLNASIDTEKGEITYYDAEHLGVAVDTERGLLVPVVKDAGDLNIAGLSRKIADLAERTRSNKITPDELGGGTFTLTNTGSRGALFDTPIINQPQVGILGTGAVVKRAVVVDDPELGETIAVRSMCYLALSYDHRLVDGADAARFLTTIKQRLEEGVVRVRSGPLSRRGPVKIVLTGASGLLGTALVSSFRADGHDVLRLVRRPPSAPDEARWDPGAGTVDPAALDAAGLVVHLAGAGLGDKPWTPAHKRAVMDSRVEGTTTIARAVADAGVPALLSASGVGYYGNPGDRVLDESDPPGDTYIAEIARRWEECTAPAARGRRPRRADAHGGGRLREGRGVRPSAAADLPPRARRPAGLRRAVVELDHPGRLRARRAVPRRARGPGRTCEPQRARAADQRRDDRGHGPRPAPADRVPRARLRPEASAARLRRGPPRRPARRAAPTPGRGLHVHPHRVRAGAAGDARRRLTRARRRRPATSRPPAAGRPPRSPRPARRARCTTAPSRVDQPMGCEDVGRPAAAPWWPTCAGRAARRCRAGARRPAGPPARGGAVRRGRGAVPVSPGT